MNGSGYDRDRDGSFTIWFGKYFLIGFFLVSACLIWAMHVANERAAEDLPSLHQGR